MGLAQDVLALAKKDIIFSEVSSGMYGVLPVVTIQSALNTLGFVTDVDGEFGPQTAACVHAFQQKNGLWSETDAVGPDTLKKMYDLLTAPVQAPSAPVISQHLTQALMVKAANIASQYCAENLQWTGMDCEVERKFLAPFRALVGQPSGRFAWCACFQAACIREAGGILPDSFPESGAITYVPNWEEMARKRGIWHSGRDRNFNPQRGDLICYDWDGQGTEGDDDHIGMVDSYELGSSVVYTLEGNTSSVNQSNGNTTAKRVRDFSVINGFIRFPLI